MQDKPIIDFHIHILPGLDDGASYWEETMSMARAAATDGTTAFVVTPHYIGMRYHNTKEKVNRKIEEFRGYLVKANLPLQVYPATEVQLNPEIPRLLEEGIISTVNNTNYLLVELPFGEVLANSEPIIAQLREMGIIPIIAHPERHREVRQDPQWLTAFIQDGGLAQVNTASLAGDHGGDVQSFASMLVQKRLVHLLGSDSHGIWQRKPGLSKGIATIRQLAGDEWADFMVHKCPSRILTGKPLDELLLSLQETTRKECVDR